MTGTREQTVQRFICLFLSVTAFGYAAPTLDPIFTSGMVLQRNQPVAVYGTADAGESVTVEFAGQKKSTVTDVSNHWKIMLNPMLASSKPRKMIVSSTRNSELGTLNLSNVLVGDVWLCAGQSNMATLMKNYHTLRDETSTMENRQVRLFKTKHGGVGAPELSDDVIADAALGKMWQPLTPEFAAAFSATACFFCAKLQQDTQVPVGLIYANRGGTQVNMWLPMAVMQGAPFYEPFLNQGRLEWTAHPRNNPAAIRAPSSLYNGTIHPLTRYAIRGVIWYQGESDVVHVTYYPKMIKDLIGCWREAWGYDFPFLCVQLAPYGAVAWDNSGESWAWQREAQMAALDLPQTEMAVITDAGEYKDIHPQNKQPVGERLALLAASLDDPSVVARSPMMQSVRFKGGKAFVKFLNVSAGLEGRRVAMNRNGGLPPEEDPDAFVVSADVLSGFEICGKDQCFQKAQAVLAGKDTVCIWSDEVSSPTAVRYGWANFPLCNLYNSAGLPASPFRTDSFELPDFNQMPDLTESDFKMENPQQLVAVEFSEPLPEWEKSRPELKVESSGGGLGIYLPAGKDAVLLSDARVDSGVCFQLRVDLKASASRVWGGVAFNYGSPNDYYVFRFCSDSVESQLLHFINGSPRVLLRLKATEPFVVDRAYELEVCARQEKTYGDGAYRLKITDSASGKTVLRGTKIDFGGGQLGGVAGCYIGTPSAQPLFTYERMTLLAEESTGRSE